MAGTSTPQGVGETGRGVATVEQAVSALAERRSGAFAHPRQGYVDALVRYRSI